MTWSESVVRRRRALTHSDSDSSEAKESTCPPPPPESLLPHPPQHAVKNCSSCSCRKSNSSLKKRNSTTMIKERDCEKKNKDIGLQQLEAKLYNTELEEAMCTERLERTQERLHRAAQLLEAQVMYTQSLDLKARALARLTHLTGNLAYKDLTPTETLAHTLDKMGWDANLVESLSEVQSVAFSATEAPEQLYQLLDEFRDKRKDLLTASNTFSQYLRSASRVSSSQLRKFESQYDSIRGAYNYSRQILESEFPKLIDERHEVLKHCFSKLVPLQEKLIEQDKQFLTLTKEISRSLQEPPKKQPYQRSGVDKHPQSQNTKKHSQS